MQFKRKAISVSVIVPVFNEFNTIAQVVSNLALVSFPESTNVEILIVDDGSTDGTSQLCMALQKKFKEISFIFLGYNFGKGKAIIEGIKRAKGQYIAIHDADLEYDPKCLSRLIDVLIANSEKTCAIYGSRNLLPDNKRGKPFYYYGGVFLSFLTNILYGTKLTDVATAQKLFPRCVGSDLSEFGFGFCYDLTVLIRKKYNLPIFEVPVSYYPRTKNEGKKIGFKDGLQAIKILVNRRFN